MVFAFSHSGELTCAQQQTRVSTISEHPSFRAGARLLFCQWVESTHSSTVVDIFPTNGLVDAYVLL